MKEIQSAAIVGMGALGMLYAGLITDTAGSDAVTFIAEEDRVEKYKNMKFTINGIPKRFNVTDRRFCTPADLVIVAVKYTSLPSALDTMANCVGPDTTIISVLNGITSEEIIGKRFGMDKVVYCIAQGMDAVKFGGDLIYTKPGELRLGIRSQMLSNGSALSDGQIFSDSHVLSAGQNRLNMLTRYLTLSGVPYTVEKDIMYRLWGKFMLNVGINQTCMAFETNYAGALSPGKAYDTMVGAMREVILLAQAEGISLNEKDLEYYISLCRTLSPEGMPSMRQDGIAQRPSEVEMFAGTVRSLAAKHGISVPVNDWLYEKIKKMEQTYKKRS